MFYVCFNIAHAKFKDSKILKEIETPKNDKIYLFISIDRSFTDKCLHLARILRKKIKNTIKGA